MIRYLNLFGWKSLMAITSYKWSTLTERMLPSPALMCLWNAVTHLYPNPALYRLLGNLYSSQVVGTRPSFLRYITTWWTCLEHWPHSNKDDIYYSLPQSFWSVMQLFDSHCAGSSLAPLAVDWFSTSDAKIPHDMFEWNLRFFPSNPSGLAWIKIGSGEIGLKYSWVKKKSMFWVWTEPRILTTTLILRDQICDKPFDVASISSNFLLWYLALILIQVSMCSEHCGIIGWLESWKLKYPWAFQAIQSSATLH